MNLTYLEMNDSLLAACMRQTECTMQKDCDIYDCHCSANSHAGTIGSKVIERNDTVGVSRDWRAE